MINRMVVNNLARRPVRTALSMLAVLIEVVLIISVVGLVRGLLDEGARRQQGIGADIVVQPPGASVFMGLSSATMPVKMGDVLGQVPGVTAVTPVYFQSFGGLTLAYGIDSESFRAVSGGFQVLQGRTIQGGYEVMIDDVYAAENKVKVGDTRELWGHDFTVVGIVEHGKGARLFVPLATVQQLSGSQGKASIFYLRVAGPQDLGPVLARFKSMLPGYSIRSMAEMTSLMMAGNLPGVKPFERIMIAIAVIIGFLVIFLAMYTTVLERTREIGILKSLGASKSYIVNVILRETVLVALAGIALGIGASLLMRHVVLHNFRTLAILITPGWMLRASLIAIGGALLGAFYPALRAARQDPIEALAYE